MSRWKTHDEHKKVVRQFIRSHSRGIEVMDFGFSKKRFVEAIQEIQPKKRNKVQVILRQDRLYLINTDIFN